MNTIRRKRFQYVTLMAILMASLNNIACDKNDSDSIGIGDEDTVELDEKTQKQIVENLNSIQKNVSEFFLNSENIAEIAENLQEIKNMKGVEEAWIEDESLCLKIENGGLVFWSYFPEEEIKTTTRSNHDFFKLNTITRAQPSKKILSLETRKACIINQQSNDENRESYKVGYDELENDLKKRGFSVRRVNAEELTIDFLVNELPDYGVVFFVTHGKYAECNVLGNGYFYGQHWLATGMVCKLDPEFFNEWNKGKVCIINIKEKRDGKWKEIPYICVSESYLKQKWKMNFKSFPENSVMFLTACQSLKGTYGLWDAFNSAGLGCYLGYTETNTVGKDAGPVFYYFMLLGGTANAIYNSFDSYYKEEQGWRIKPGVKIDLEFYTARLEILMKVKNTDISIQDTIDLGLSVKWGTRNIDANAPWEYGSYFAWGEIEPKTEYSIETYKYYNEGKYDHMGIISGTQYDVARQKLGEHWRMPTSEEYKEIISNCGKGWKNVGATKCLMVVDKNGSFILFPAAGSLCHDKDFNDRFKEFVPGRNVFYWSGTDINPEYEYWQSILYHDDCGAWEFSYQTYPYEDSEPYEYSGGCVKQKGMPIRPVYVE